MTLENLYYLLHNNHSYHIPYSYYRNVLCNETYKRFSIKNIKDLNYIINIYVCCAVNRYFLIIEYIGLNNTFKYKK